MPPTTIARRYAPLIATCFAATSGVHAQEAHELIRAEVEQLRGAGDLVVDGVAIASRNLVPRIYEARAFEPTWTSQAQIDSQLETIDESYREGLEKWDRARIDASIASGRTQTVFLDKPIAVKLLYWTAEVDATGRVSFFPDVYSRDKPLIDALARPSR